MRSLRMAIGIPPQITLMQASIISIVWEMMWRAPRPSKRSTPTVGMPLDAPFMKADRKVEILGRLPERLVTLVDGPSCRCTGWAG